MDLKSKIESLMPGAWSKVLFLGSLVLCIGLYKFFPDLPKSWLPQTEAETFLIRILLSGSVLLFGSVSLIINLLHHNRKIESELSDLKKQNTAYFHQVSSLNTDKNTLQALLYETKQNFDNLTAKQISLRESNSKLDELNKIHLSEIARLSGAANEFREEFIAMRNQAVESQKALQHAKDECNARLMLLKEKYEKEVEELKSQKIEPASASSEPGPDDYHATRRSFFHADNDRPKRR